MIEVITCTQKSLEEFWNSSALGLSLQRLAKDSRLSVSVAANNRTGLPVLYNQKIFAVAGGEILVFAHDDLWLDDYFFADRLLEGLQHFEVLGLAGNRRRLPRQPSWAFIDTQFVWDDPSQLSGAVAHGPQPFGEVARYGPAPASCQLLDGLLLAARKSDLIQRRVSFDARFQFHFYDLDFCRTAVQAGLRLGTWPICVTHQSGGRMGTPEWWAQYQSYLEKWGD
jgi:hypothetical protein